LRYDTIKGYAEAAITLFLLRDFPVPFSPDDKTSIAATILRNIKEEENIAVQRAPLTVEMFAVMLQDLIRLDFLSMESCIIDQAILGRYIGPRLSEYGQKSHNRAEYHDFPSGKSVLKAICADDIIFLGKDGRRIQNFTLESADQVAKIRVKFKVQKNRRNGEEKEVLADSNNKQMCPAKAAFRIVVRSRLLQQPTNLPCGVYSKAGKMQYLTGQDVSTYLRKIARKSHPDMDTSEIKRFSAHSFRVTAAVLLHEQGHDGDYIKIQLRWMGDSYRVYLRSTPTILEKHTESLGKTASISIGLANLPTEVSHLVNEINEHTMGTYKDI